MKRIFSRLLALGLTAALCAAPASALEVDQALELLRDRYVDQLPAGAESAATLDELLASLNDSYTVYFTAEEYAAFLEDVDGQSVTGIGVSIQTTYENGGFAILSILPDSPALEAGMEAGDRVIAVDGTPLTPTSDIRSLIAGEEGTPVTITALRGMQELTFTMVRRSVLIPIVTYRQEGTAGFIDCDSFGATTPEVVETALKELDRNTAVWIMDLRSNPGGTTNAAAGAAGPFVGAATMIWLRDANGNYTYTYTTSKMEDLTDKPLLVLTSPYSASGSEMFAGDARDLGFGIGIGQRTYGKGVAQVVLDQERYPDLFHGDALKVTAYRFYSPSGTTNHITGVLPTLLVSQENTQAIAQLLSAPETRRTKDHLKIDLCGFSLYVSLEQALEVENRPALTELLEALPPAPYCTLYWGNGSGWNETTPDALSQRLELDYTSRFIFSDLDSSPELELLTRYGMISGYEDGTFRPNNTISRAEFATLLSNALSLPAGQPGAFSDVEEGAWYTPYVSALATRGFISGYEDGTFRPEDTITLEEMISVLASAASWLTMDGYELIGEELDMDVWLAYYYFSEWAQKPANTLSELGVDLAACMDLEQPAVPATRLQAAQLLYQTLSACGLFWVDAN